jgi:hypothetical protein
MDPREPGSPDKFYMASICNLTSIVSTGKIKVSTMHHMSSKPKFRLR